MKLVTRARLWLPLAVGPIIVSVLALVFAQANGRLPAHPPTDSAPGTPTVVQGPRLAVQPTVPRRDEDSYLRADNAAGQFALGTDQVELRIARLPAGGWGIVGLTDRLRGREWLADDQPSDPFRLAYQEAGLVLADDSFQLRGVETTPPTSRNGRQLTLTLERPADQLWLRLSYAVYSGTSVFETWYELENLGETPLTVDRLDNLRLYLAPPGAGQELVLHWVNRGDLSPQGLAKQASPLTSGSVRVLRSTAESGENGAVASWLALENPTAQAGLFAGWEWSGRYEARIGQIDDRLALQTGIDPLTFTHALAPGAKLMAPRLFIGLFGGGVDAAATETRYFADRYIAPPAPANYPYVRFNTWYAHYADLDEATVLADVEMAASLGIEAFAVDHGWEVAPGQWQPDPVKFPRGLEPIVEAVKAHGMKFGLWMGYGTVDEKADVFEQHPEWLATRNGEPQISPFGYLLCLARSDVREWATAEIERLIERYQLDWFEYDLDLITDCDQPGPGHQGTDSIYVATQNFYDLLDGIRQRHPDLLVENVSYGGHMLDYGMLRRADTSSLTDYSDPFSNQFAAAGAAYLFPPRFHELYMSDHNWRVAEIRSRFDPEELERASDEGGIGPRGPSADDPPLIPVPDLYVYRSGQLGLWTISVPLNDPGSWADNPDRLEILRGQIESYKRWRDLLRQAEVATLMPQADPDLTNWHAQQFYTLDGARSEIFVFGPAEPGEGVIYPRGLQPDRQYRIRFEEAPDAVSQRSGAEIMAGGIAIRFAGPYGSDRVTLTGL